MTVAPEAPARAYVNFGRWIADCPQDCGNAMCLEPGQTHFYCDPSAGCGGITVVDWPERADAIWSALMKRKAPKNRNWFPSGHQLALKSNCPHGQSPAQLDAETREYTDPDAPQSTYGMDVSMRAVEIMKGMSR